MPRYGLKLTPSLNNDNGNILLRVESAATRVDCQGKLDNTVAAPLVNVDTVQTTLAMSSGTTALIVDQIGSTQDKSKKTEVLWILTTHVVQGK